MEQKVREMTFNCTLAELLNGLAENVQITHITVNVDSETEHLLRVKERRW